MLKVLPGMMTCADADAFVVDYLDGRLKEGERRLFERHIHFCRPCRAYLKAYKRTLELSRAYGEAADKVEVPRMPEQLIQAILAAKGRQPPPTD
ncbi:MAG: anti-sigma factor family protein [Chromatiales bacterium]